MSDNQNRRTYEVKFVDGAFPEKVEANDVEETSTRIRFVGHVPGVLENNGLTPKDVVVVSFLNSSVESYRLMPASEREAAIVGKNLYQVNFADKATKQVPADIVKYQPGQGESCGRYSLVTHLDEHGRVGRAEFIVPENLVHTIERIDPEASAATVVVSRTSAEG